MEAQVNQANDTRDSATAQDSLPVKQLKFLKAYAKAFVLPLVPQKPKPQPRISEKIRAPLPNDVPEDILTLSSKKAVRDFLRASPFAAEMLQQQLGVMLSGFNSKLKFSTAADDAAARANRQKALQIMRQYLDGDEQTPALLDALIQGKNPDADPRPVFLAHLADHADVAKENRRYKILNTQKHTEWFKAIGYLFDVEISNKKKNVAILATREKSPALADAPHLKQAFQVLETILSRFQNGDTPGLEDVLHLADSLTKDAPNAPTVQGRAHDIRQHGLPKPVQKPKTYGSFDVKPFSSTINYDPNVLRTIFDKKSKNEEGDSGPKNTKNYAPRKTLHNTISVEGEKLWRQKAEERRIQIVKALEEKEQREGKVSIRNTSIPKQIVEVKPVKPIVTEGYVIGEDRSRLINHGLQKNGLAQLDYIMFAAEFLMDPKSALDQHMNIATNEIADNAYRAIHEFDDASRNMFGADQLNALHFDPSVYRGGMMLRLTYHPSNPADVRQCELLPVQARISHIIPTTMANLYQDPVWPDVIAQKIPIYNQITSVRQFFDLQAPPVYKKPDLKNKAIRKNEFGSDAVKPCNNFSEMMSRAELIAQYHIAQVSFEKDIHLVHRVEKNAYAREAFESHSNYISTAKAKNKSVTTENSRLFMLMTKFAGIINAATVYSYYTNGEQILDRNASDMMAAVMDAQFRQDFKPACLIPGYPMESREIMKRVIPDYEKRRKTQGNYDCRTPDIQTNAAHNVPAWVPDEQQQQNFEKFGLVPS